MSYSGVHTSSAYIILLSPLPMAVNIPLAIGSHYAMDLIGEAYYGSRESELLIEASFLTIQFLVAYNAGNLQLMWYALVLGNLIDFLDKWVAPKLGFEANTWFSCHYSGYSKIQLDFNWTIGIGIAGVLLCYLIGG